METEEFYRELQSNDYGKQYLDLVAHAQAEKRGLRREKGYEIHHIKPRAFAGGHEEFNRVKLTTYEHCLAHILLAKAIPCYKTLQPLTRLAGKQIKELTEADEISLGVLLEDFVKMRDEVLHAKKPEATRQKIAEANRRKAQNPEWRKSLHKPKSKETIERLRKPKTEEHRKKLGEVNRRKSKEYWEQKKLYLETGTVEGSQLQALLRRSEKVKEQNDRRRQVALLTEFKEWYVDHGFNDKGKRLNKIVCVSRYLKQKGLKLEDVVPICD